LLIHFTQTINALDSITRNGFLFLHNETEILSPVLHDSFGISGGDNQSNGMVCFTDLPPEETLSHQNIFGSYGVGVSKEWLIKNDIKKVEYVEVNSEIYDFYVCSLKAHFPQKINGRMVNEIMSDLDDEFDAIQFLSGNFWGEQDRNENAEYLKVLEKLAWTQTHKHIAESEWRIRNPKPYRFKGSPTRKQQVDLLVSCINNPSVKDVIEGLMMYTIDGTVELACVGKLSLALPLPKDEIKALFCPKNEVAGIRDVLDKSGMNHIQIYASDDDEVVLSC